MSGGLSQVTGELVITCPKLHYDKSKEQRKEDLMSFRRMKENIATLETKNAPCSTLKGPVRVAGMLSEPSAGPDMKPATATAAKSCNKDQDSDFEDDPDCPPLE